MAYKLVINNGCLSCGKCSYILPGWPEQYHKAGLLMGKWSLDENEHLIDKLVQSCPLDLIELQEY